MGPVGPSGSRLNISGRTNGNFRLGKISLIRKGLQIHIGNKFQQIGQDVQQIGQTVL